MFMNRTAAALIASLLGLALSTGCATSQRKSVSRAKSAKVANKKSRYTKGSDNDYSLGDVDEKLLKRGQESMSASAFDAL